ncbi:unnamed protein product [Acanthoscelides obtectus]|uniref:Uncharacterized protein n=1 Tax=Acanthoscelides obtectus TaxID=200917 RepID=A0A9P0LQ56_ACAOB|nr:unnamed protein product [Acanthoscelides obtectus]CAK1625958.1 hypothetical protein AOBTE_LOCUS3499 [Acanthoscelides obtectus]
MINQKYKQSIIISDNNKVIWGGLLLCCQSAEFQNESSVVFLLAKMQLYYHCLLYLLIITSYAVRCEKVTFKNVTFKGYSLYTEKFKKTISSGSSLKDYLPETTFDGIEFKDQNIPVLYKDSLADLHGLDELKIESCGVEEVQPGSIRNAPNLFWLSLKGETLYYNHVVNF